MKLQNCLQVRGRVNSKSPKSYISEKQVQTFKWPRLTRGSITRMSQINDP